MRALYPFILLYPLVLIVFSCVAKSTNTIYLNIFCRRYKYKLGSNSENCYHEPTSVSASICPPVDFLVTESDLEVYIVGSALDDLAVRRVGESSRAVNALAILALSITRTITTLKDKAGSLGEFARGDEGNICAGGTGVLERSFDEGASFAVQSAVAGLEVSDERLDWAVTSIWRTRRENVTVLD